MNRMTSWLVIQGAIAVLAALTLSAQPDGLQARMTAVLRYAGVPNPPPDVVARMTELWTRAQQSGLAREERRLAWRDMYLTYTKLKGVDFTASPQSVEGLTQFVMSIVDGGGRMDLTLPEPRGRPTGRYLHVETRGRGPVPLLLISDVGVDGRKLYDSFAERQGAAYTMHIVTLPYAGAARPLPWSETLDHAARPWLSHIEGELMALLDQPRMKGVTVIGTSAGGYFAARLALARPRQIRAVVLVNALVKTALRARSDPDMPAIAAERLERVKTAAPGPQLFPIAPVPPADELKRLIADPGSTHPTARNWMAFAVKDPAVSRAWTYEALSGGFFVPSQAYQWELTSTDLTEQMRTLAVPLLAMGSWHDEESPLGIFSAVPQWEEMKLLYPAIPLTIAAFDGPRSYISADSPEVFDRALVDFLAGRPVQATMGMTVPRRIPSTTVRHAVGGTDIEITHGQPAVGGRNVWGSLVPNGRVWRAGANEATRFTFSRAVTIDGHSLAAGTYTFFAIPGDGHWTLIFNRVPRQWGASDYNPAFDALRVTVKPADAAHEESLRYTIQSAGPAAALVTLTWEKRAVTFRIEVSAQTEPIASVATPGAAVQSRARGQSSRARGSARRWIRSGFHTGRCAGYLTQSPMRVPDIFIVISPCAVVIFITPA